MRRLLVLLLSAGMLGAGVAAADAKPAAKAPRLHAFRSCTNLLGYAQRNGAARDPRERRCCFPVAPMPIEDGARLPTAAAAARTAAAAPRRSRRPRRRRATDTSQTNVQEAGVDEPDWVKAAGTTLFVARQGRLRAHRRVRRPPARARLDRRARLRSRSCWCTATARS